MLALLRPFWVVIAKWVSLAAGIILILLKVRQSGSEAEQRKQSMKTLKGMQIRDKIENNIAADSDTDLSRMQRKWTK